jgi:DnaJ family protein C protein 28
MDRLVEDLIQESMSKGDFENLSGAGKPLPQRVIYNPYEDFTTYKVKKYKNIRDMIIM